MRLLIALALVLLILFALVPVGMAEMQCPMCTPPDDQMLLGLCASTLSLLIAIVLMLGKRFTPLEETARGSTFSRSIYRPPRPA